MHGLGAEAVPSLMAYLRWDIEHQLGSASFVAAALERLDAMPTSIAIDGQDRMALDGMLNIMRQLAEAAPEIPADPVNGPNYQARCA
jgi:hypothetical protein